MVSKAQQITKSYAAISIGASVPYGDYAKTNTTIEQAGYAQTGANLDVEAAFFFDGFVGVGAKLGIGMIPINQVAYGEFLASRNPDYERIEVLSATPYFNTYIALGLYFNIPITEKLQLTPKVMGGLATSFLPEVEAIVYFVNGEERQGYTNTAVALEFMPIFGGNLRYLVSEKFMLQLNVDRMSTVLEFEYDSEGNYIGKDTKYSVVNIMVGAGLLF